MNSKPALPMFQRETVFTIVDSKQIYPCSEERRSLFQVSLARKHS